jgi:hypothetical protein
MLALSSQSRRGGSSSVRAKGYSRKQLDRFWDTPYDSLPKRAYGPEGRSDLCLWVYYKAPDGPDRQKDLDIEEAVGFLSNGSGTLLGRKPIRDLSFNCATVRVARRCINRLAKLIHVSEIRLTKPTGKPFAAATLLVWKRSKALSANAKKGGSRTRPDKSANL